MSYSPPDVDLEDHVRRHAACGFDDPQTTYERLTDTYTDVDEAVIDRLVDVTFEQRAREMATWPGVTDCDRLDRAFEALEGDAIVARHHFACCQRCGTYEIHDEIADVREAGHRVDGYVFYHWQDTDSAVAGGALHLRYGGVMGTEDAAIGARIVEVLRSAGLDAQWNGDPRKSIEVRLAWQRRSPPRKLDATYTAESCIAAWCEALPRATLGAAAANAGAEMPLALQAAGASDAALAWARADADSACALARLAVARSSPELLIEAWQLAPWDRNGTFIRLMIEAPISHPTVFALARDKVDESRRDEFGGASAAWFFALAPEFEPARDRARAAFDNRRDYAPEQAVIALAAGLWRAGDGAMKEVVTSSFPTVFHGWAQEVAIAAAPTADDVMDLAAHVDISLAAETMRLRVCKRLLELGEIERARAYAKEREALQAFVAWRTGDRDTIAALEADFDEHATKYEEGLLTATEVRDIRMMVAASIDPARGRAVLAELAARAIKDALAEGREVALAQLAGRDVAAEPVDPAKLAKALAAWQPEMPRRQRFKVRRMGRTILVAAAACARGGELDRARELVAIVCAPFADEDEWTLASAGITDELVAAFVALGELARVEDLTPHTRLSERALGCYIPALVAAGDHERAIELLGPAVTNVDSRMALLELLPAILAVAGDATGTVHEAWQRADEIVGGLHV